MSPSFYVWFFIISIIYFLKHLTLSSVFSKFMSISKKSFISCVYPLDKDECTYDLDNCHADALCTNTKGSFNCTCLRGYEGDGIKCTGTR